LIVAPTTNGRFLQVCFELQQQLFCLEDVPPERIAELHEALPGGEVVQTGYTLVVAWGQRPAATLA
jgi:hypothetical protein